ncbi:hypothetical protein N657DRAFT_367676 [Parathielavia appendiculata]|uniref:Uncharacterized protein n=1 Tax=Parathielavia appendiculata TaxID=2587402 RepID=A0AAN6TQD2_9PEZI|nr:hypothetical protein N657DRAFT_367676 [Parathielavia appendiculata]
MPPWRPPAILLTREVCQLLSPSLDSTLSISQSAKFSVPRSRMPALLQRVTAANAVFDVWVALTASHSGLYSSGSESLQAREGFG